MIKLIRDKYVVDAIPMNRFGIPFEARKLKTLLNYMMENKEYTAKDFLQIKRYVGVLDVAIIILKQVQSVIQIGVPKENIVFISGIGCSLAFLIIWIHLECILYMEEQQL